MKYLLLSLLFVSSNALANEGLDRVVNQHRIESEQRLIDFQQLKRESEERLKLQEQKVFSFDTEGATGTYPTRSSVRARINNFKSRIGIYGRY